MDFSCKCYEYVWSLEKVYKNQGSYVEKIYISFMLNARQSFLSTSMDLYMRKGLFSSLLCQTFFHTMLFFQQMKRPIVFSNCKHLHHDQNFFLERCEIIDLLPFILYSQNITLTIKGLKNQIMLYWGSKLSFFKISA